MLNDRDAGTSIVTSSAFVRSSGEDSVTKAICIQGSKARSRGKMVREVLKTAMQKISVLMWSSLRADSNIPSRRCWKR